jgi:hypothetical protein
VLQQALVLVLGVLSLVFILFRFLIAGLNVASKGPDQNQTAPRSALPSEPSYIYINQNLCSICHQWPASNLCEHHPYYPTNKADADLFANVLEGIQPLKVHYLLHSLYTRPAIGWLISN